MRGELLREPVRVSYREGVVAIQFFLLAVIVGLLSMAAFPELLFHASIWSWTANDPIAVLIGGILGGYMVRPRAGR